MNIGTEIQKYRQEIKSERMDMSFLVKISLGL